MLNAANADAIYKHGICKTRLEIITQSASLFSSPPALLLAQTISPSILRIYFLSAPTARSSLACLSGIRIL